MRKLTITFIFLIAIIGCKSAMKTVYGIKKPKLESRYSVNQYLMKNNVDTTKVFLFKDFKSMSVASSRNMLIIPDAMFYNRNGDFVPYKESTVSCNANVDKFLNDLASFSTLASDKTKTIADLGLLIKNGDEIISTDAEVTVVITWTVYVGKLNKDKAFEWIKLLKKAQANGTKVKYYLLNCDFQKTWNLSPNQISKLGIKT